MKRSLFEDIMGQLNLWLPARASQEEMLFAAFEKPTAFSITLNAGHTAWILRQIPQGVERGGYSIHFEGGLGCSLMVSKRTRRTLMILWMYSNALQMHKLFSANWPDDEIRGIELSPDRFWDFHTTLGKGEWE